MEKHFIDGIRKTAKNLLLTQQKLDPYVFLESRSRRKGPVVRNVCNICGKHKHFCECEKD